MGGTIHALEWQKKKLSIPSAGKDIEQLEFPYIAGENAKRHSHSRKGVAGLVFFLTET